MMPILLVAIGTLLAFAVWIAERRSLSRTKAFSLSLSVATVAVMGAYIVSVWVGGRFLGATPWYNESPWRELLLLFFMMAGMAVRYLTAAIEERRERIKVMTKKGQPAPTVPLQFDVWEFSYPLLFSVVTFGSLLGQLKDEAITLANVILSFQTGFFWQTLLKRQIGASKAL